MKIRLKNTKLLDEHKNPLSLFHVSPQKGIERFFPLSHFGTQLAARMRLMHFVYQTLGLSEPSELPEQLPTQVLKKFNQCKNAPKLSTYSAYLALKSPVRIPDLCRHSLEQYYYWFTRQYAPKSLFLSGEERCEGDVVGAAARIKYKTVLSNFIFRDPFTRSEQDLKKELQAESFYDIPQELQAPESIPYFLSPIAHKMDKRLFPLAEKVAFQRLMRYLESEGHDGFVYRNEYEDKGQNSYIIFRPEQVFDLSKNETEHVVKDKTPEQKSFLQGVELNYFKTHGMLSPLQRIQNHLEKLQKSKLECSK